MEDALAVIDRALEECRAQPAWAAPDAALIERLDATYVLAAKLAAVQLALLREIDGRAVAVRQGATGTAAWLRDRYRLSPGAATRQVTLAGALDVDLPATARALAAGAVNVEQAQAIAAAVADLPATHRPAGDTHLAGEAATFGPRELTLLGRRLLEVIAPQEAEARGRATLERAEERAHAGRDLRLSEVPGDGRVRLTGWLDREAAACVRAALDPLCSPRTGTPEPEPRTPGQRRADALVAVCRLATTCGDLPDHGGDRPQVAVTVTLDTLRDRIGAATLDAATLDDGTPLSATAARRIACDAAILPAVLDTTGQVLDLGRERRLFAGPLRRALILRDHGCAFPGCDRPPRWCDGHHITHWADGGKTSLDNAVLLCGHHHRLLHHSPWQVHLNPTDGLPEFTPPTNIDQQQQPRRNRYHRRQ